MSKELKSLMKKNPDLLNNIEPDPINVVRHFMFSALDSVDLISLPVCGVVQGGHIKHKMHAVNCTGCLAALEAYADVNSHDQALAHAFTLVPKIITPDPAIMQQKHGAQPTIQASRHIKAKAFLDSKFADSPSDLPKRMIGGKPRTFYKNMTEIGIIDVDGERTGLSAQDLADGKLPEVADKITED